MKITLGLFIIKAYSRQDSTYLQPKSSSLAPTDFGTHTSISLYRGISTILPPIWSPLGHRPHWDQAILKQI